MREAHMQVSQQQRGVIMPTYGYQCTQCQHEFSVFQAMKDAPLTQCPQCEGTIKRLLYPVGIVFKGSGWYINDSRKPEKASESGADGDTPKSEGAKDAKPTEATPATDTKPSSESAPKASSEK
jgi:putative FmdB family regulatory protein